MVAEPIHYSTHYSARQNVVFNNNNICNNYERELTVTTQGSVLIGISPSQIPSIFKVTDPTQFAVVLTAVAVKAIKSFTAQITRVFASIPIVISKSVH